MIPAKTRHAQNGFVLVVVLGTIILMSVLLLGFNRKCRAGLRDIDDFSKSQQARNYARAGLNIAIAAVKRAPDFHADRNLGQLFAGGKTFSFDNGCCSVTITPENGKLNVNLLRDKNQMLDRTRIDQLLRLIDLLNRDSSAGSRLSYNLVPSIIDWTDPDDQVTCLSFVRYENSGAEKDYYKSLDIPRSCSNGPLDTIEQLLLVKAMKPDSFERMSDYLTVHGGPEVNVNFAPQPVIESLSDKMDAALAEMIVERRKLSPFTSVEQLRNIPGMTNSIYSKIHKMITVGATGPEQYYHVVSHAEVDMVPYTIEAVLRTSTKTAAVDVIWCREFQKNHSKKNF
ncbi:MAG: type II secretion system minor pseudopilin [Planctomycetota bacterium]|jgi:general secretion pathway protein K